MKRWAEINLENIKDNYNIIREGVPDSTKVLAVVKADAYGHGAYEVSRTLEESGVDYLGVAEVEEGISLRKQGIITPILVFGPFLEKDIIGYGRYDLEMTISSVGQLKWLENHGKEIKAHLKIETGFTRTGIKFPELDEIIDLLNRNANVHIKGVYSHLHTANDSAKTKQQREEFIRAFEYLESRGIELGLKHLANSQAILNSRESYFDLVRAGTILYGQVKNSNKVFCGEFKDSFRLKARVIYINEHKKGQKIGYASKYTLKRDSRVGIVPLGFYHGINTFPKSIKPGFKDIIKNLRDILKINPITAYAYFQGKKVPIVGKVGMQQIFLDLTDFPEIKLEDVVEISVRRTGLKECITRKYI